jgi:hypothetical protein
MSNDTGVFECIVLIVETVIALIIVAVLATAGRTFSTE